METILVLPLYLMLLGGMFVIGELLLGRYRAHDIDRALAWRAADRFGPTAFDDDLFKYATGTNGISPEIRMLARSKEEGKGWENSWLFTVGGRADVKVEVPWWSAFINVQGIMADQPQSEAFEENFLLNSHDGKVLPEPRVWVCRRRLRAKAGPYSGGRENAAAKLNWIAIAYDVFPGTAATAGKTPETASVEDYKRCPLAIAVSGDWQ